MFPDDVLITVSQIPRGSVTIYGIIAALVFARLFAHGGKCLSP
jgi:alkylated DNA nucleotide flippase Atl1